MPGGRWNHLDPLPMPKEMTKNQYNKAREVLGLSIVGASALGVSRRQAQRIAAGDAPVPGPLAHLIRLMVAKNVKPQYLEKLE